MGIKSFPHKKWGVKWEFSLDKKKPQIEGFHLGWKPAYLSLSLSLKLAHLCSHRQAISRVTIVPLPFPIPRLLSLPLPAFHSSLFLILHSESLFSSLSGLSAINR